MPAKRNMARILDQLQLLTARLDSLGNAISAEGKTQAYSRRTRKTHHGSGGCRSDQWLGSCGFQPLDGRCGQAVDAQVAERLSSGQEEEEQKTRISQLRGGQLQQRGCRVDYVFKRRERNRSSGKVEGSHGSKPRGLPKPHGKQDDESRKMHRDKVHPRSAGDWRVCPSRVCGDPEAHGGEQASPGEVTYSEDDGCYGTVFDRRELDSGSKIDWRRGTTMGALERPGLGCPEASIRLNEAGGVHLVGGDDQRIEGGGMADEVKVKSKATRKVARMIRVRLQRPNEK